MLAWWWIEVLVVMSSRVLIRVQVRVEASRVVDSGGVLPIEELGGPGPLALIQLPHFLITPVPAKPVITTTTTQTIRLSCSIIYTLFITDDRPSGSRVCWYVFSRCLGWVDLPDLDLLRLAPHSGPKPSPNPHFPAINLPSPR